MSSTAFHLRPGEPVDAEVRRVARGRIANAVGVLRDPDADPVEAVHTARKDMKKLRSTIRLVRPALGEKLYAAENGRYRDAAGMLSDVRDAQVRSATVDALAEHFAADGPRGGWARVRGAFAASEAESPPGLGASPEQAAAAIAEGESAIDDWPLGNSGFKLIAPGLRRAHAQARGRYREALDDPTDERLHEYRKRSKDLWYHLRLVREGWPGLLGATADEAHRLSDLLGDDHDLVLLIEYLDRGGGPLEAEQLVELRDLIGRRRHELQRDAFAVGARLLAEKPKRYTQRLRSYWEAPRP